MKTLNLFAEDDRLKKLTKLGDQLEKLDGVIKWEIFRPTLKGVFAKEAKGAGGRPPYDYVLMFKILILQRISNKRPHVVYAVFGIDIGRKSARCEDHLEFSQRAGNSQRDGISV